MLAVTKTDFDALLAGDLSASVQELIPDSLPPAVVVSYSKEAASRLDFNAQEYSLLLAIMGRLHALARTNKAVLEAAGVKTIGEFEEKIIDPTGQHRSSIYKSSTCYRIFPTLTPADYVKIGSTNLEIASRAGKAYSPEEKVKLLEAASTMKVAEFRQSVEKHTGEGSSQGAAVTIYGDATEVKEVLSLCADPEMQEKSGDKRQIGVVLASLKNLWAAEPGTY